MNIHFCRCFSQ